MAKGASFHRVKVTNNVTNQTDVQTVLNFMHKYQPRIHVVRANHINSVEIKIANWTTITFPETEFMAVTAYQNSQVRKRQKYIHNANATGSRRFPGRWDK
jgi:hypothetical protein